MSAEPITPEKIRSAEALVLPEAAAPPPPPVKASTSVPAVTKKPSKFKVIEHQPLSLPAKKKEVVVVPPPGETAADFSTIVKPPLSKQLEEPKGFPATTTSTVMQDPYKLPSYIKAPVTVKIPTVQKLREARIQHGLEVDTEALAMQEAAEKRELVAMCIAGALVFASVYFGGKFLWWMMSKEDSKAAVVIVKKEKQEEEEEEVVVVPPPPATSHNPKKSKKSVVASEGL